MLTLKIQKASIELDKDGDLHFFGEAITEIMLLSWGSAYEFDMRNKIEKSKCYWRVKDKDAIDLSIERGLEADVFIQNVKSNKFNAIGYLNYYHEYDALDFEIFLSNKNLNNFRYIINKIIQSKNLIFEIRANDFSELASLDKDVLPTLESFYNKKKGIILSDISFSLR